MHRVLELNESEGLHYFIIFIISRTAIERTIASKYDNNNNIQTVVISGPCQEANGTKKVMTAFTFECDMPSAIICKISTKKRAASESTTVGELKRTRESKHR